MAVARDQAARVVRAEVQEIGREIGRETEGEREAGMGEQLRTHVAEEKRRQAEAPTVPGDKPVVAPGAPAQGAAPAPAAPPKSGKRKFILFGFLALLVVAAASYTAYYVLIGRFFVSTDDAYVRANNTMLGARVAGHIAAILPGDNTLVHKGNTILKIDDGDYKIAVDAARTKIATQEATIARIGRQVTAAVSAVEQAEANLASAEAGLKRAGLDYDRQQSLNTKGFA